MKSGDILKIVPKSDFPIGLGGCHNEQMNFDCCVYDLTIFDGKNEYESITEYNNNLFKIYHATLSENRINILIQFENMRILSDPQWELQMFLSKINEKKESIFNAFTKNSIIESQICLTNARNGLENSDPFTSSWIKSAAYFLTDAILSLNNHRPTPSHMLDILRNLKPNKINQTLSIILDSLGLERSTISLLKRMSKSAVGLSDIIEKNNNSSVINQKINCFLEKSLFSDCYFYIGYINRNNFYRVRNNLHEHPEIIHILKTGFDLDDDDSRFETQIESLTNVGKTLLKSTHD